MIYMHFPSDNDLLTFLEYGEFDKVIRQSIDETGSYNIINSMREEEEYVYKLYKFRSLVMFSYSDKEKTSGVVANIIPINRTTVEQYSFYTTDVHPYEFAKYGKIYFNMVKSLPIVRIQATVLEDNAQACKWHKRLGFNREGLLRKYDGKNNYWLYAYIKE